MMFETGRLYEAFANLGPLIDERISNKNILTVFENNYKKHPQLEALFSRQDIAYKNWQSITWHEYATQAHLIASALNKFGVEKDAIIPIISRNRAEHNISDIAILYAGGIPSSLYPTLKSCQLLSILKITKSNFIFIDTKTMLDQVLAIKDELPHLKQIVTFEPCETTQKNIQVHSWQEFLDIGKKQYITYKDNLEKKASEIQPHDYACILFTSGTTGEPKGVCISHENILWTIESYLNSTGILNPQPRMISYLPMAHITERVAHHYHSIARLGQLYFALEVADVKLVLPTAKPTLFFAVPRVWEKFQNGMLDKIHHSGKEALISYAIENGMRKVTCEQLEQPIPLLVYLQHIFFTWLIFNKMKKTLGLDKTEIFGSGAAPLDPEVHKFFHAIDIPITEVYGLTENTAPALSNYPIDSVDKLRTLVAKHHAKLPKNTNTIGTVGYPIPGTRVKVNKDGELLIKGKHIFSKYYNNPKATEEAFTLDGWFKTGDIGKTLDNGMFQIIARKKELIITSGGKNIAPVEVENMLKKLKLVGSVCVIGDRRNYLTALITLNHEGGAQTWARKNQINSEDIDKLAENPIVYETIGQHIEKINSMLARVQQIKKFTLLKNTWAPETGELTPTLKLKRFYIEEKYHTEIEKMYQGDHESDQAA